MGLVVELRECAPACRELAARLAASLAAVGAVVSAADGAAGCVLVSNASATDAAAGLCRRSRASRTLVVMAGPARSPDVLRLMAHGASDVLPDADMREVDELAARIVARLRRWQRVDELVGCEEVRRRLVGCSGPLRALVREVVEAAAFTVAPVLLTGESGTGKELVAGLVHALDSRPDKGDLVLVDCTTVVPTLSGSEFFGHERGAFTGAVAARDGAFARADRGTLFLDEVGELPASLQAELLRAVQEQTYKRVGGNVWRRTNFRLVCATNRDLLAEERAGRFRLDLYYRLAGVVICLPPLRSRLDDVVPLFQHFLAEFGPDARPPPVDPVVQDVLRRRDYPGNVRDLRQLAQRVSARRAGPGSVSVGDLPEEEWQHLLLAGDPHARSTVAEGGEGDAGRVGDGDGLACAGEGVATTPPPRRPDSSHAGSAPGVEVAPSGPTVGATALGSAGEGWAGLESWVRCALASGLCLKDLQRVTADAAVQVAVDESGGNLRRAAARLGVTERALQLRRASARSSEPEPALPTVPLPGQR